MLSLGAVVHDTDAVTAPGILTTEVASAVAALRLGGLVALPTETVYGLGADATNADAVARIYRVKGRPSHHPVIVHIIGADALAQWADVVPGYARRLADALWPGPLTLVLPRAEHVGNYLTGGADTVALRSPDHPLTQAVLRGFGGGVAAPSANRFGRVSPTTAQHVLAELGDRLDPGLDRILDGGPCPVGLESTIVDATGNQPRVLRPGAVSTKQIETLTGQVVLGPDGAVRAPGTLASHYAPTARVVLTEPDGVDDALAAIGDAAPIGIMALATTPLDDGRFVDGSAVALSRPDDVAGYARDLYGALRRADDDGLRVVLAVLPPDEGVGHAIRDRLQRAAHQLGAAT